VEKVGFDKVVKKNASTEDTLQLIVSTAIHNSKLPFARECAARLCPTGTAKDNCLRNIFEYYCRNVSYKLDPDGSERIYTPNRIIIEGEGDCKKAATFLGSVLMAAGIDPIFKHVTYSGNSKYSHIYIIVGTPDNYITLDPTNGCKYNSEVDYNSGTLYYTNGKTMELRSMGKVGLFNDISNVAWSEEIGKMENDIDSISCNVMGAAPKIKLTHEGVLNKLVPSTKPALKKALQNIPIDSQRGSFLTLVKNNYNGIATHLATALGKDPNALNELWKTIGGDQLTLKQAVIKGATQNATNATELKGPEYIGFSFKKLLHAAAGILHVVGSIVSIVAPAAGAAISSIGDKAEAIAIDPATPNIQIDDKNLDKTFPPDPTGQIIPHPNQAHHAAVHGSFLYVGGFIFKSVLLISILHINQDLKNLLGTVALVAPLVYLVIKNKSKWILKKF